jgi:chromate transporter
MEKGEFKRKLRLLLTSLKLGCIGFGGGMAVLSLIHSEFVKRKKTCSEDDFLNAAALSQSLPGAISFNAMTYLGLRMEGFWGATLAGWGFMLPSFLLMIGLSMAYDSISHLSLVSQMLNGMVAGVVGLILAVTWELAKPESIRCRFGWIMAFLAFVASLIPQIGIVEIVLGSGAAGMVLCPERRNGNGKDGNEAGPSCRIPAIVGGFKTAWPALLGTAGTLAVLAALGLFFVRVGLVTFGGGFVMIPMIQKEVVNHYHWLTAKQFADGMALGQLTPGPVVITATFVGYKVAGLVGAWVASTAVFLPSYVLSLLFGYSLDRWKNNPAVASFLNGVRPAVVGLMGSAAVHLMFGGIHGWEVLTIIPLATLLLIRYKISPIWIMFGSAVLGLLLASS